MPKKNTNSFFLKYLGFTIWLTTWYSAESLGQAKVFERFVHQSWQTNDGLGSNGVLSIIQHQGGYMYIGTFDGLKKFDGDQFVTLNIPYADQSKKAIPLSLANNMCGSLVIGTEQYGAVFYHPTHGFKKYDTESGLPGNMINALLPLADTSILAGTNNGLVRIFNHQKNKVKLYDRFLGMRITGLGFGLNNKIWVGTESRGLWCITADSSFLPEALNHQLPKTRISALLTDRAGRLWIGVDKGLYVYYRGKLRHISLANQPGHFEETPVTCLLQTAEGRVWVGTRKGLAILKDDTLETFITTRHSLTHNDVRSLTQDAEGNVWVGTYRGGFVKYARGKILRIENNLLLGSEAFYAITETRNGQIWAGGYGSLANIKTDTILSYTVAQGYPFERIRAIVEHPTGHLWLGTYGQGLIKFNLSTKKVEETLTTQNGLKSNIIRALCTDANGNLWVGSHGGLNRIAPNGKITSYEIGEVNNLLIQDDKIWVFTDGNGLHRVIDGQVSYFPPFQGLSSNVLMCGYALEKNILLVGTNNGLNVFYKNVIFSYKDQGGFFDEGIFQILPDGRGNIWMGSSNGLFAIKRMELIDFIKQRSQRVVYNTYDQTDGLTLISTAAPANGLASSDGRLWFPSLKGINVVDPNNMRYNDNEPKPLIEGVYADDIKIEPDQHNKVIIPPNTRNVKIKFTAFCYVKPNQINFKYMLNGLETDWQQKTNQRFASYGNLPPRQYLFRLKAQNEEDKWSAQPITIRILQKPSFFQTAWFKIGIGMVLIVMGYLLFLVRLRQISGRNLRLEALVADRVKKINQQKDEIEIQKTRIDNLYTEMRASIRTAKLIQKSILPSDRQIEELLPESFIFYQPKDIVSGDFYWIKNKNNYIYFAVADCTGHGVAGAFISLIGHNLLNRIADEAPENNAANVLNKLNTTLIQTLKQHEQNSQSRDGMDISLVRINRNNLKVDFAGAFNHLYLVRNQEFTQIKADKFSVGYNKFARSGTENQNIFTNHEMYMQPGDYIYLYTDGFADQIGGENGTEKYKYNRFRDLIRNIAGLPMRTQRTMMQANFEKWRENTEQLDDVLVAGIKF